MIKIWTPASRKMSKLIQNKWYRVILHGCESFVVVIDGYYASPRASFAALGLEATATHGDAAEFVGVAYDEEDDKALKCPIDVLVVRFDDILCGDRGRETWDSVYYTFCLFLCVVLETIQNGWKCQNDQNLSKYL